MTGHEIRYEILLLAEPLVHRFKRLDKAQIHRLVRLSHQARDAVRHMLGSYAQLSADMMAAQDLQEIILCFLQVIKAYARTNEHLLHAGQGAQTLQYGEVFLMIGAQVLTRRRKARLQPGRLRRRRCCHPCRGLPFLLRQSGGRRREFLQGKVSGSLHLRSR